MKRIICLSLFFCFIEACSDGLTDKRSIEKTSKTISQQTPASHFKTYKKPFISKINHIDSNGLKQGMWISRSNKNRIKHIETFLNDTLNGYWFEESNGFQKEGYYEKGLKQGYFWCYRLNHNRFNKSAYNFNIYQEFFYKNDTISWMALPEKEMGYLVPLDDYITSNLDSVYAKGVYRNGSVWFEGAYINKNHVGIHRVYFPNGKLHGEIDYDKNTVIEFDSLGNFVKTESLSFYKSHTSGRFE